MAEQLADTGADLSRAVPGRPRVVAAAVEPNRRGDVIVLLNRVVAAGGSALLITADGGQRHPELELDPRVETLDLVAHERRLGVNGLVTRDPNRLLHRMQGRTPPGGPSPAWATMSRSKPYRMVRPWLLWRALRRQLDVVRVAELDHIVIVHQNSWPIAWQLRRLNRSAGISYEVPDAVWQRAGRPVPPPPDPAGS